MNFQFLQTYLDPLLDSAVSSGCYPGVQALVLHGEEGREVYHRAVGLADAEAGIPVARDTLYRMFSSSKNVTGVASAMCAERGLLSRRAQVHDYLPAFKDITVGPERRAPATSLFVWHVLSMTSGFSYDYDWSKAPAGLDTVGFVSDLARRVPLQFDPGDQWMYGYGADIAGALVETVAGMRFGEFLRREIFEPLGMKDTGFIVPESKRARLAAPYEDTDGGRGFRRSELAPHHLGLRDYRKDTTFESGGAGLVSTIDDWAAFCRMLLAGGVYGGHRFLSPAGMSAMLTNQLTPHQARTFNWADCEGHGYSHFFHIKRAGVSHSDATNPGTFAWGGWLGTNSFVDPVSKTVGILMVQRTNGAILELNERFRSVVSAAVSL